MHFVQAKSLLSQKCGMNIYRGCTHGCIYCDSRSECYQMKHDFEDIEVKENAPILLERELKRKRHTCMIGTGAMCDPYMHCEEKLCLTRKCLEIINKYGFGVSVQTKSDRILRDCELLAEINGRSKAVVNVTVTTLDDKLCGIIEPEVCPSSRRFEVLDKFRRLGVPTIVWLTPILPFINDTEENIRGIAEQCARCGVKGIVTFGGFGLTLRRGDREYFYKCLDKDFPGIKEKYIKRYGLDYELPSDNNKRLMYIFTELCGKYGIMTDTDKIFRYIFDFEEVSGQQLSFL
ncbi:MAG TPA: radical SAM protein [Ruminococcaceae bacterium]|nr:radical SAM protein [Oscillospiraceae bacterium]